MLPLRDDNPTRRFPVLTVALIVLSQTFYVVDQTHQALVIRLGEVVRTVNASPDDGPGLKIKVRDVFAE